MLLLTGPAGSGKTRRVLAGFREALAAGQTARLIVPTATLAEHLRNELARDGLVFRSNQVSTLARFLAELAPTAQVVPSGLFHLMVEHAVLRTDRPEFHKVRDFAGFHARLARTLDDLDSAGCTPQQLSHVRLEFAPFRDALVAIWINIQDQLRVRDMVTRGALLRMVIAALPSQQLPERIWMDGFAQLSRPEIEFIAALGAHSDLTLTLPGEGLPHALKPALLQRGFTEEPLSGGRGPRTIAVMPETAERECEEIARRLLECAAKGMPFREMGVVVRQREPYEALLRPTFERFGIPAHFYFSQPLARHAAGRLLSTVVDALLNSWEHEQTLGLMLLIPGAGVSDGMDAFEIKVLEALPGQGLESLMGMAGTHRLKAILRRLSQLKPWLQARYLPSEWAERISRLASLFRPSVIPDGITRAEADLFRSQAAGFEAFSEAMQSAAKWWSIPANPIGLAEFWNAAHTVVRLSSVTVANRARNVVHVISPYEARQWDLAAVFVCGLVERQFPAQTARDPFLQDAALRDLARQGICVQTSEDKEAEERGLFQAVCARARDLVVLTYPRTDARGQRNLRSIFLKELEVDPIDVAVRPALPEPVARWRANPSLASSDILEAITAGHTRLSVTSLESLLQCPFQFFANRALRIKEMPTRPEDRLDFLLQGNIIHAVLNEWVAARPPLRPLFESVFDRICQENRVLPGFRTERLRRFLFLALQRFADDTKYPSFPARTEQSFELPIHPTLTVTGKFDRVDQLPDGRAVVIDYKFSRTATSRAKVDDPTKLQGPLYAIAAERVLNLQPAAMLYLSLKDDRLSYDGWGEVPGVKLNAQPLTREWMDDALRRVIETVEVFRSGVIHPHPANTDACRFCDYKDACRIDQPAATPAVGA